LQTAKRILEIIAKNNAKSIAIPFVFSTANEECEFNYKHWDSTYLRQGTSY